MANKVEHIFKLQTSWDGGRNDTGEIHCEKLQTTMSIPKEMGGPGIGTNPDELLLSAAASCYIISLAAMLERSNVKARLVLQSDGIVQVENNIFTYKQIIHHIEVFLHEKNESHMRIARRLALKAEETCMISKALRGNVDIAVDCKIVE
ncbi:SACOL1771 family peroxiredoxin [Ureibacillus chungkukjangi]|uniref:Peroxiredoxin-like protein n=1 Tax=Ureibacillus chungkukjangi TaxID=1202712 RepID=A0A318TN93_9BACL|nr:SACOL1771 family peroxiredoxin [Ureibacillus chungkukjangi]MCM3388121.1 SACOL1771 family peroxiredoxin [Ureibacillus chungkukjangi]PYF06226.1 peroxiredoxin-like protein [Ureibacillus chungkukjangi]